MPQSGITRRFTEFIKNLTAKLPRLETKYGKARDKSLPMAISQIAPNTRLCQFPELSNSAEHICTSTTCNHTENIPAVPVTIGKKWCESKATSSEAIVKAEKYPQKSLTAMQNQTVTQIQHQNDYGCKPCDCILTTCPTCCGNGCVRCDQ